MIESLQGFAASFPEWLQWSAIVLVGAIPAVESYFGALIGVAIGLPVGIAIAAAVLGNAASMIAFVYGASSLRRRAGADDAEPDAKRMRIRRMFDRFGVPGVSLLGQTFLPSQLTAATLVGFGASRRAVIGWQVVSIVLWGTVFGLVAAGLI